MTKKNPTEGLFNGNPYVLSNGSASTGYFESATGGTVIPNSTVEALRMYTTKTNPWTSTSGTITTSRWEPTTVMTSGTAVPSGGGFTLHPDPEYDTRPIIEALVRDLIHRKYPKAKLL